MRDKRMGKKDSEGNELKRGKEARGWVGVVRGEEERGLWFEGVA